MSGPNRQKPDGEPGRPTEGDTGQPTAGKPGRSTAGAPGWPTEGDTGQPTAGKPGRSTAGETGLALVGCAWRPRVRRVSIGCLYGMAGALLLSTGARAADRLTEGLTEFLLRQYASPPVALTVVVKTPEARRPACGLPQFSLPANNRARGNISIQVMCGNQKSYVQAEVHVTDRYLVTVRPITANQTLAQGDVAWQTGRVDNMSVTPLTDMAWVYGSLSERAMGGGQVLTAAMLRRPWLIKTGQPVQVTAQGEGFSVQGTGKAMGNAAVNDRLRVRMESGQMVVGLVNADGGIRIEP